MARERGVDRLGIEGSLDGGLDERLLVREDAEDRALGDAGRLGDLARGDAAAVRDEQRERGGHDGGAAFAGGQRRGAVTSVDVVLLGLDVDRSHRGRRRRHGFIVYE